MPRCLPIMTSFFDRFLIDFCSQLGPPNPENSRPHSCESTIFLKSHFDVHMDFWLDSGANLPPFYPPKSTKILQKSDPKSHQNFDRFLLRFFLDSGSVLGTKLEPCWPPFSSQDAPRRPKDGHKTPQDAPKTAKDTPRRPKTPPRRPQGAQNPPQTTILEGFGPSGPRFWTLQTSIFHSLFSFWRGGGFAALLRCWINQQFHS